MLRIHCFSCQFACYRLLLEFPPTILKQYSVLNTAIFNLKHSSPDPSGKIFPVVFKMCSDTLFEIPLATFLFPPCWDRNFRHSTWKSVASSKLRVHACGVGWLCLISANISSLSVVNPENDQWSNNDSKHRLSNNPECLCFQSESKMRDQWCRTMVLQIRPLKHLKWGEDTIRWSHNGDDKAIVSSPSNRKGVIMFLYFDFPCKLLEKVVCKSYWWSYVRFQRFQEGSPSGWGPWTRAIKVGDQALWLRGPHYPLWETQGCWFVSVMCENGSMISVFPCASISNRSASVWAFLCK